MTTFNIPAGYKLVPLEPTKAMQRAAELAYMTWSGAPAPYSIFEHSDSYRAMLAAAPPVDAVPGEPEFNEATRKAGERCPQCRYQYGHQIGCDNNPIDMALATPAVSRAEGLEPLPELFGLSFSEARSRILAMPLDDARRMTISLLIQLGIVQKYATPIAPSAPTEPSAGEAQS